MEWINWHTMSREEAMQAAARITDHENFLNGIAETKDSDVRKLLLQRLSVVFTQLELSELAIEQDQVWLGRQAVLSMGDGELLHEVVVRARQPEVRIAALEKLNEPLLFRFVALNEEQNLAVRRSAVTHLRDKNSLMQLAMFGNDSEMRELSQKRVEQLGIQPVAPAEADENGFVTLNGCVRGYFKAERNPVLPEAAEATDSFWPYTGGSKVISCFVWVWVPDVGHPRKTVAAPRRQFPRYQKKDIVQAALAAISAPEDYLYVLRNDPRASVRCAAIRHILPDEAIFLKLALEDPSDNVRYAAAQRLQDPASFDELFRLGTENAQRFAASRTTDLKLLKERALESNKKWMYAIALDRVYDWTLLEIIAMIGKVQGETKHETHLRMEWIEKEWRAHGIADLNGDERICVDAAKNDAEFYRLVIDDLTDEACIADILCSISPHTAGATAYGPTGEAKHFFARVTNEWKRENLERVTHAIGRLHTREPLERIATQAKAYIVRSEAKKRIAELFGDPVNN